MNENTYYSNQTTTPNQLADIRTWTIRGLLIVLVLVFGYFVYSYGFLEIEVVNETGLSTTHNVKGSSEEIGKDLVSTTTVRRFQKRGNYEVKSIQNEKNAFHIVKTGGFFRTTKVKQDLKPELSREFVGNNPLTCLETVSGRLLSYDCGTKTTQSKIHVPATPSTPTYTTTKNQISLGLLEDTITTDKTYGLVRSTIGSEIDDDWSLYAIDKNGELFEGKTIEGLNRATDYTFDQYQDGFIAVDESFKQAFTFKNAGFSLATKIIDLQTPTDQSQKPSKVTINNNVITATFNNADPDRVTDGGLSGDELPSEQIDSSVVVNRDGESTVYSFAKRKYYKAFLCGDNLLCAQGEVLDVYRLEGDKTKLLTSITETNDSFFVGDKLYISRDDGIMLFDPLNNSGNFVYTFGPYSNCGVTDLHETIAICAIDSKLNKVAISLGPGVSDQIDKKINSLKEINEIKAVSIYGKYIFVTPNYGVSGIVNGESQYNGAYVKKVDQIIEIKINSIGIDNNKYELVGTLSAL